MWETWVAAFAYLLFPLVSKFPVFTAAKLVIDETYERCKGKWHYFYACMNLDDHHILAPHFSERRNAKAVDTTL
ncbi:MAG: DDE-type integrase/transposase/recombinase, partial [Candidatus Aerophobetes bacterium]|nr:DDE-type integrase/transposase/recombinase [Candidatus Aerophobetes bacterium]